MTLSTIETRVKVQKGLLTIHTFMVQREEKDRKKDDFF